MIEQDPKLRYIYDEDVFVLKVDDREYKLSSQIIKKVRDFVYITPNSKITIYMKKNMINEVCDYPENNSLEDIFINIIKGEEN